MGAFTVFGEPYQKAGTIKEAVRKMKQGAMLTLTDSYEARKYQRAALLLGRKLAREDNRVTRIK